VNPLAVNRKAAAAEGAAPAPAPPGRRAVAPNLARRPFLNARPVVRVAALLWLLGGLLLLGNVLVFRKYLSDSEDIRGKLAAGRAEIDRQRADVARLEQELAGFDLEGMNEQVEFLNRRIDQRTFSWSLLLDRLAETMPDDIRLSRLQPPTQARGSDVRRSRSEADEEEGVPLAVTGDARDEEALLVLMDNLFAHPSFANPDLTRERRADGLTRFDLTVVYRPGDAPPGEPVVVEEVEGAVEGAGGPADEGAPAPMAPIAPMEEES
jgi:Tfp pilus assembly protein PilN